MHVVFLYIVLTIPPPGLFGVDVLPFNSSFAVTYCQPNIEEDEILNGRISCTDDNREGSQCSVSCATNYQLVAEVPVRECQKNGEWTGSTQTCELGEYKKIGQLYQNMN